MNQIYVVDHPVALGKRIRAQRPSCACRGAKIEQVEGTVGKVIHNSSGYWYYLTEPGVTVKGQWVDMVY